MSGSAQREQQGRPARKIRPRVVRFKTEAEIAAELDRLRARGYRKLGKWSLPQICKHLALASEGALVPPATTTATPEQAAAKRALVDVILTTGRPPVGMETPPFLVPPDDCDDCDVDHYKTVLVRISAYPHAHVDFGPFGPVSFDEMRAMSLIHAAHHLGFLEPACSRRDGLAFADEEAVAADVRALRDRGYARAGAGAWTLPQACFHLDQALQSRMKPGPFPPNTPEQDARRPVLEQTLATGKLPDGLPAPDAFIPPDDVGDDAVDAFLARLAQFKAYPGPIAQHRLFGNLPDDVARRLNLIHCAHHLSYLVPAA